MYNKKIQLKKMIESCKQGKKKALYQLYKRYSPVLLGVSMCYTRNKSQAEDVLQDSFIKIYNNIEFFKHTGSFEGWMKRIVINTAINHNKASLKYAFNEELNDVVAFKVDNDFVEPNIGLEKKYLLQLIQELPTGYRTVFNLFVLEEMTHKEISKTLGITINTSKSQLFKARKVLQEGVKKLMKQKVITSYYG